MKPAVMLLLRRAPFLGFRPGSNFWPMVELGEDADNSPIGVDGEDVREAIASGWLRPDPLKKPAHVLRHPTDPQIEVEIDHRYYLTAAGLAAVEEAEAAKAKAVKS